MLAFFLRKAMPIAIPFHPVDDDDLVIGYFVKDALDSRTERGISESAFGYDDRGVRGFSPPSIITGLFLGEICDFGGEDRER